MGNFDMQTSGSLDMAKLVDLVGDLITPETIQMVVGGLFTLGVFGIVNGKSVRFRLGSFSLDIS